MYTALVKKVFNETLLIIFFFFSHSSLGQSLDFSIKEVSELKEIKSELTPLGEKEGYIYLLEVKGGSIYAAPANFELVIHKLDAEMNLIASKSLQKKNKQFKLAPYNYKDAMIFGNKLLVFAEINSTELKGAARYIIEYEMETFLVKKVIKQGDYKRYSYPEFHYEKLFNEEGFGLMELVDLKDSTTALKIKAFDSTLTINADRLIEFKHPRERVRINDIEFNNEFVSFISVIREKNDRNLYFNIVGLYDSEHFKWPISIDDNRFKVSDVSYKIYDDSRIFLSGFCFGDIEDEVGSVFTQNYDLTTDRLISEDIKPFNFDYIGDEISKRIEVHKERSKESYDFFFTPHFYVIDMKVNEKTGESFLSGVRNIYEEVYRMDDGVKKLVNFYPYHKDVFHMKSDSMGNIKWAKRAIITSGINRVTPEVLVLNSDKSEYIKYIYYEGKDLKANRINKGDGVIEDEEVILAGKEKIKFHINQPIFTPNDAVYLLGKNKKFDLFGKGKKKTFNLRVSFEY